MSSGNISFLWSMDRFPRKECVGILNPTFLLIDFPQRDRKSIPTLLFFVSTGSIPQGHPLPANSPKNILGAAAARASCEGLRRLAIHRWDPGFGLCPDFKAWLFGKRVIFRNQPPNFVVNLVINVSICRSFWEKSSFIEGILVEARGNHHQSLTSYYLYQSRCYSHF